MTTVEDLDLDYMAQIPIRDGVPYMAEGHQVARIVTDQFGGGHAEYVITDGGRRDRCRHSHEWSRISEGTEGSHICWNCDAVKFPVEVLLPDE